MGMRMGISVHRAQLVFGIGWVQRHGIVASHCMALHRISKDEQRNQVLFKRRITTAGK